jgi:hypothetical protein
MKSTSLFIISIVILVIIGGCQKEPDKKVAVVKQPEAQQSLQVIVQGTLAKVVEKINDGEGYTYVFIDTGKTQYWAAAPEFQVSVGSMVIVPEGTRMTNYHNKPLNRDFDAVMFVDAISLASAGQVVSPQPAVAPAAATPATVK